ncbi:MAG: DUF4474 domain-containing protein [Firmicutes bacterium]|nr:DUF4474 domain-containing protein [Bacillota bacterium]
MLTSLLYTVLSAVLSIVIAFANAGKAAETPGTPAWDAGAHKTFGAALVPRYDITFDERLGEALGALTAETGFDIPKIAASLPDFFRYQRWMTKLFPGVFYGLRDQWLVGNEFPAAIVGMPAGMRFVTEPEPVEGSPDEYRVLIEMSYADGSTAAVNSFSTYNTETGILGCSLGIFNLGFNLNLKENYAYTAYDPFMRVFGYCKLYDDILLQNKAVNADTLRLKFPYDGMDWMLQLWKGRYFNTSGGEVGLYHKPASRLIAFYDAASNERIGMSFEVCVTETGRPLVVRPVEGHWWMTGFAMSKYLYVPNQLTLKTEIIPTDAAMKEALMGALDKETAKGTLSYTVSDDGARLSIRW